MNFSKYGSLYSRFHGCTSFRIESDMVVLDFAHMPWETWFVTRLHQHDKIFVSDKHPFVQALGIHFKSDTTSSVFCKQDSWTILMGKERVVMPMPDVSATFQLYATPFYVRDPGVVANLLQTVARPAHDHVYPYKNTVLYLDGDDLPYPGGCYFGAERTESPLLYRICIVTSEPLERVVEIAAEWKMRREVTTVPFLTRDVVARPKFVDFKPIGNVRLSDDDFKSTGTIQKRHAARHPDRLIQDVIHSYLRHGPRDVRNVQHLGLVLEWPLRVAFEGSRVHSAGDEGDRRCVALAVNGKSPKRVVHVRRPYERYIEYESVPVTTWTAISYDPEALVVPEDIEKVCIDSIVIGFKYRNAFFCLSAPLLEGRPSEESQRNVRTLFSTFENIPDENVRIIETVRFDPSLSLHRVQLSDLAFDTWCLSAADEAHAYPIQLRLPPLVDEWLNFFGSHRSKDPDEEVDTSLVRLALVMARHKICFQTKIDTRRINKNSQIILTNDTVELHLGEKAVEFINGARLEESRIESNESAKQSASCSVM